MILVVKMLGARLLPAAPIFPRDQCSKIALMVAAPQALIRLDRSALVSADSVVIPVRVLTPSMSSSGGGAGFSIALFNVGVLVTRGADGGWTNGKIKYWVAGNE